MKEETKEEKEIAEGIKKLEQLLEEKCWAAALEKNPNVTCGNEPFFSPAKVKRVFQEAMSKNKYYFNGIEINGKIVFEE